MSQPGSWIVICKLLVVLNIRDKLGGTRNMLTHSRRISLVLVTLCRFLLSEVRGMTSTFKFLQFTFAKFGSLYWTVFGTHHIQTWSICKCRPVPASVSSVNNLLRGCLAPVIPNPGACVARTPQYTNTNTPQYTRPSSSLTLSTAVAPL